MTHVTLMQQQASVSQFLAAVPQNTPVQPGISIDPWLYWTPETIADALTSSLGHLTSVTGVRRNWPIIADRLAYFGDYDRPTCVAVLATVRTETNQHLDPIEEYFSHYWYEYSGGPDMHGRGYVQITHDYNYIAYSRKVSAILGYKVDLVANPELALRPDIASLILALYFHDNNIPQAARRGDWYRTRTLVNGSPPHGWPVPYMEYVNNLRAA